MKVNKIICGDCLEVMQEFEDNCIDAIITDPPYNTTACAWDSIIPLEPMWEQLKRIIKPNGAIVLFGSEPFSSALRMSNIKNYKYDWVWEKSRAIGHLVAKKVPMKKHELISVFYKKAPTYNPQMVKRKSIRIDKRKKENAGGSCQHLNFKNKEDRIAIYTKRYPTSVLKINNEHNVGKYKHPTQKPVPLIEYLIKTYTNKGELVLDFCIGSGTTAVAAIQTGRCFIGIEQDSNFVKIANQRINNAQLSLF